ncbi:DUF5666 domain-containing protein [Azoarcus sp. KH32C]|uniref:DUF5666 domain-containing protein n=1 Tax=Azoarcus sp. KH32C TaxID=748247 RepID=UPI0002385FF4|nr:DUF5666 domain-containing protein [Azoarcus sp. KH32C]BAL24030.1 hypothetical protein AZKH_1716 [Azoarcus sp. KH32C]
MTKPSVLLRQIVFAAGLLSAVAPAVYAAPVCIDPGGIGGTGAPEHEGGIGGTGSPAHEGGAGGTGAPAAQAQITTSESGIGGTGAPVARAPGGLGGTGSPTDGIGGTGIVGTITGFASICVNGLEVHYGESVPLTENGMAAATSRLAVGQVVSIETATSDRGLEARSISILNAFEGPVTDTGTAGASLRVMGRPVRIAPGAHVDAGLRPGDPVRVSGLRNAVGDVVATRIERAPAAQEASAVGFADRPDSLQGLPLAGKPLTAGTEFLVRGQWASGRLEVARVVEDPAIPFAGRVREAVVEGLVARRDDRGVRAGGFTIALDPRTTFAGGGEADLTADRRIRVHGVFSDRREIRANRVEFVRDFSSDGESRHRGQPGASRKQGESDDRAEDESHGGSGRTRVESDDGRLRIETEDGDSRERIERTMSGSGEIEREKVERQVENADGEVVRRERIEIKNSGDRTEIRERIEVFDGGKRVERIETIQRIERPTTGERPERIDRTDKVERPERSGKSGRD